MHRVRLSPFVSPQKNGHAVGRSSPSCEPDSPFCRHETHHPPTPLLPSPCAHDRWCHRRHAARRRERDCARFRVILRHGTRIVHPRRHAVPHHHAPRGCRPGKPAACLPPALAASQRHMGRISLLGTGAEGRSGQTAPVPPPSQRQTGIDGRHSADCVSLSRRRFQAAHTHPQPSGHPYRRPGKIRESRCATALSSAPGDRHAPQEFSAHPADGRPHHERRALHGPRRIPPRSVRHLG